MGKTSLTTNIAYNDKAYKRVKLADETKFSLMAASSGSSADVGLEQLAGRILASPQNLNHKIRQVTEG
jgi:replicative DNA helicase